MPFVAAANVSPKKRKNPSAFPRIAFSSRPFSPTKEQTVEKGQLGDGDQALAIVRSEKKSLFGIAGVSSKKITKAMHVSPKENVVGEQPLRKIADPRDFRRFTIEEAKSRDIKMGGISKIKIIQRPIHINQQIIDASREKNAQHYIHRSLQDHGKITKKRGKDVVGTNGLGERNRARVG